MHIRTLRLDEWDKVAALIHTSTNAWYMRHLGKRIFPDPPSVCRIFPEVYETLDPGCGRVIEDTSVGRLAASCFFHPRATHLSLGIMNVHPDFAGRGLARALLRDVCALADQRGLPVRLVSSALNLDSYSLYTRAGFAPRALFQDLIYDVPAGGPTHPPPGIGRVRPATLRDLPSLVALDTELAGVRREQDFRLFLNNPGGHWRLLVHEITGGGLTGYLASVDHPGCRMIGPGAAYDPAVALALIWRQWDQLRGRSPVLLVPAGATDLVAALYQRGARNCELHVLQSRGEIPSLRGIVMPTFLPETL